MRKRLTEGLALSSLLTGGLASPRGELKSGRWSSRSEPSYELQEELRLSAGERPSTSCRLDPCCGCWGGKPDGVMRSRGGELGSDLMLMLWLVLIERLEPWGSWPPPLQTGQDGKLWCFFLVIVQVISQIFFFIHLLKTRINKVRKTDKTDRTDQADTLFLKKILVTRPES